MSRLYRVHQRGDSGLKGQSETSKLLFCSHWKLEWRSQLPEQGPVSSPVLGFGPEVF